MEKFNLYRLSGILSEELVDASDRLAKLGIQTLMDILPEIYEEGFPKEDLTFGETLEWFYKNHEEDRDPFHERLYLLLDTLRDFDLCHMANYTPEV